MNKWFNKFLEKTPQTLPDIPDNIRVRASNNIRVSGLSVGDPSIFRKNDIIEERLLSENLSLIDSANPSIEVIPKANSLTAQEIQAIFDGYNERAAILEYDAGITKAKAEQLALEYTLTIGEQAYD